MHRVLVGLAAAAAAALTLSASAIAATLTTNCHPGQKAWVLFIASPGDVAGSAGDFNYLTGGRRTISIGLKACPALSGGCTGGMVRAPAYPWGTVTMTVKGNGIVIYSGGCIDLYMAPAFDTDSFDVTAN